MKTNKMKNTATTNDAASNTGLARAMAEIKAKAEPKAARKQARKLTPESLVIDGARVVRRITPRLALIERIARIEALNLDVTVQLYYGAIDGVGTMESKNKADVVAWIKANRPAHVPSIGNKRTPKAMRHAILALSKAERALSRAYDKALAATDEGYDVCADQIEALLASTHATQSKISDMLIARMRTK